MDAEQKKLQLLLRLIRKEAGLSQQALASLLGKPQSFVSKYESGERRLDILELRHICQVLSLNISEFVKRLEALLGEDDATESQI